MRLPPPARIDPRRAADIYVSGRTRAIPVEEKRRRAARELEAPPPGFERVDAPEPGSGPRYGVPVPEELDFHRGAGTWRERIGQSRGGH